MTALNQRGEEDAQVVRVAEFRILGPGPQGYAVPVHFNPESLEYTLTNNIKEQGNSTESKQQVSKSSGKLSMELTFDTTLDGSDVREQTEKLQAMMKPVDEGGTKIAPVVEFAWGVYRFRGIFSSYKETLDYFSATGVPLRASISLSMTQQDGLFDPSATGEPPVNQSEAFQPQREGAGPVTGDPKTDRSLAEDNGEDNPRFFSGRALSLPSGPDLRPPAAFASVGLSLGVSASVGVGIGVDVGFSAGVSAGIGIGIGIEAGIDVGLSAGFDVDIGLDITAEATVSGSSSARVRGGASTASASGAGASTGFDGSEATARTLEGGAGLSRVAGDAGLAGAAQAGTGAAGGEASGGFAGGGLARGGPGDPIRSRSPVGLRAAASLDPTLGELPSGPRFGSLAAAGVPAALGAFAGLRPVPPRRRKPLSLAELQGGRPERSLRTDAGASFEVGGRAADRVPRGLSADVGARASLSDRITFDVTPD
jgi:hypothetical protein